MPLEGYLLDVYPDYEHNQIISWLKSKTRSIRLSDEFYPQFYVYASYNKLKSLAGSLEFLASIKNIEFKYRRIDLVDPKLYKVLELTMNDYQALHEVADMVNKKGKFSEYQLFNVDLRLSQKYMFDRDIFPLAYVRFDPSRNFQLVDEQFSTDYTIPEFLGLDLDIEIATKSTFATYDDPLTEVHITPMRNYIDGDCIDKTDSRIVLEDRSDEAALLTALVDTVRILDPDILYTTGGDKFIMPYLYHRAEVNGVLEALQLGREAQRNRGGALAREGKSYFTYGQIKYKPPFYALKGRIHIDKAASFMFSAGGLHGLIEIARISGIPFQTISRLSPGSAISAMQISQAMRDGMLVKWKKNMPEGFKSARDLLNADRGGHTFEPEVGVHENVIEIDFASLYPNIIVHKNISPETLLCKCCRPDGNDGKALPPNIVPAIGYHICKSRRGLIPRVIDAVITRRMDYKRLKAAENDMYDQRQKVLKWLLVTCFGYTGYRNARFGRIECHEAITAFSRDILLDTMEIAEGMGYTVLHGIVDSLWVTAANGRSARQDCELLCETISAKIGIPIELEGIYKWIAFLNNKGTEVGALTRYYGLLDTGEFKVRGLELRQRNTPALFNAFQRDILRVFAQASTRSELMAVLPEALGVFKDYAARILEGSCEVNDLVIKTRVSRTLEGYRVFNDQVAALTQMAQEGVEVNPGESVRYIILDHRTKDPQRRVKLAEMLRGNEQYDRQRYLEMLLRVGESILRPFGYTEGKLRELLYVTQQIKLT